MLTPEQRAMRTRGIGASEVAAICGISPFKNGTPLAVWMRKATPTRAPIIDDADEDEEDRAAYGEVGDVLEPSMLALYERRTGFHVRHTAQQTRRHPEHAWALASPDGEADAGHIVQVKVVGRWMAHHWDGGVPDYVRAQIGWECFVTGSDRCDVAVLLNGTEFQSFRFDRDRDLEAALFDAVQTFWFEHVEKDEPPPPGGNEDRKAYLAKRFPRHRDVVLDIPTESADFVAGLIAEYDAADKACDAAKTRSAKAEAALCELVGEAAGIRGPWGDFTWKSQRGQIAYKAVSEALAPHGVIPADLLEKHRGRSFRKVHRSYPKGAKR